jgi:soluble lytic murein transglycosylase-like protein
VVQAESGGREGVISKAGAIGYTQLMPATARQLGVNPYNPLENLQGGAKYLKQKIDAWNGNVALGLASYNAGYGNVQKWVKKAGTTDWNIVKRYAFKETRNYVDKII